MPSLEPFHSSDEEDAEEEDSYGLVTPSPNSSWDQPDSPDYRPTSPSYYPQDFSPLSSDSAADQDNDDDGSIRPAAVEQSAAAHAVIEKMFPPNPRYATVEQHFVDAATPELECAQCFAAYDIDLLAVVGQPDPLSPPCACNYLLCLACVRANMLSKPQPDTAPLLFTCIVCGKGIRKLASLRQLTAHRMIKVTSKRTVFHGLANLNPARQQRFAEVRKLTAGQLAEAEQYALQTGRARDAVAKLQQEAANFQDEVSQLEVSIEKLTDAIATLTARRQRRQTRRKAILAFAGDFGDVLRDYPDQLVNFPNAVYAKQLRAAADQLLRDLDAGRLDNQLEKACLPPMPDAMAQSLSALEALGSKLSALQTRANTLHNEKAGQLC